MFSSPYEEFIYKPDKLVKVKNETQQVFVPLRGIHL